MKLVDQALASQDPEQRKAGLLAMAVSAEGCADNIKNKYAVMTFSLAYRHF